MMIKNTELKIRQQRVVRQFTKYCVYYITGGSQDAEIDCFDENNNRSGIIYFFRDDMPLPSNRETVNGIYLYYRLSSFADVMTIIKEEKPLALCLDTFSSAGYVTTEYFEPIGEQEGV